MSWLSSGLKKIEKGISNVIPHAHSADRRASMQAAKEQIDYYKTSKDLAVKSAHDADEQKKTERNKINKDQIRAKQRTYRRGGFMAAPEVNAPKETLG